MNPEKSPVKPQSRIKSPKPHIPKSKKLGRLWRTITIQIATLDIWEETKPARRRAFLISSLFPHQNAAKPLKKEEFTHKIPRGVGAQSRAHRMLPSPHLRRKPVIKTPTPQALSSTRA
jgi:hypothetical protein